MNKLFVAWQEVDSREWHVVGALERYNDTYRFSYTKASTAIRGFERFGAMKDSVIESKDLPPFFQNRLLNETRPEYENLMQWMALEQGGRDPFTVLALTEGKRGTDTIEIFPCPEPIDGKFHVKFFAHGVRHTHVANQEATALVKEDSSVYLMRDIQNEFDPHAIAIRSSDPVCFLGYLPRYLARDVELLIGTLSPQDVSTKILKINGDAPLSFRFLCEIEAPWPGGFSSCSGEEYQLLS